MIVNHSFIKAIVGYLVIERVILLPALSQVSIIA